MAPGYISCQEVCKSRASLRAPAGVDLRCSRSTFWKDIQALWELAEAPEKVALLGGKTRERLRVQMDRPFAALMGMDLRYFDVAEDAKALEFCRA